MRTPAEITRDISRTFWQYESWRNSKISRNIFNKKASHVCLRTCRHVSDYSLNINSVLPKTFPPSHISRKMKISAGVSECSPRRRRRLSRNELAWNGAARRHANFPALIELSHTVFSGATRRPTGSCRTSSCGRRTRLEREFKYSSLTKERTRCLFWGNWTKSMTRGYQ